MIKLFDCHSLHRYAESAAPRYRTAIPFPHEIIDGLLNEGVLKSALDEFPTPTEIEWFKYDNPFERKLATNQHHLIPPVLQDVLWDLNSSEFVKFLEALTGVSGLIPDADYIGGGLHQIERGGKLDIHADFNYHPKTNLNRRVNVLLFLNDTWKPEFGGELQFWNCELTHAVRKIAPIFNRLVIFNSSDVAYHGHPEPLRCPEGMTRKSIAVYYYTQERPERALPHSTVFKRRPSDVYDPALEALRTRRALGRLIDSTTVGRMPLVPESDT